MRQFQKKVVHSSKTSHFGPPNLYIPYHFYKSMVEFSDVDFVFFFHFSSFFFFIFLLDSFVNMYERISFIFLCNFCVYFIYISSCPQSFNFLIFRLRGLSPVLQGKVVTMLSSITMSLCCILCILLSLYFILCLCPLCCPLSPLRPRIYAATFLRLLRSPCSLPSKEPSKLFSLRTHETSRIFINNTSTTS